MATMNGGSTASTTTDLNAGAYSFYLNVVVLNQSLSASTSSHPADESAEAAVGASTSKEEEAGAEDAVAAPEKAEEQRAEPTNLAPAAAREEDQERAVGPAPSEENDKEEEDGEGGGNDDGAGGSALSALGRKGGGLLDGVTMPAMPAGVTAGFKSLSFGSKGSVGGSSFRGGALDKSLHNTMKAVSTRTAALSDKAGRYVAGKTMIARASAALDKALPVVVRSISSSVAAPGGGSVSGSGGRLDLTVGRRFMQGPVIVLQVDLRASGLPAYVEAVRGEDAAEHYRCALSSLRLLGATSTAAELEREMLPIIRKGLMERMGEEVVKTMKEKDESGAPLEVECIALEEGEEARWLFTYMEFQSQMK